jgi:aspartate-semialdehyde dehydrogenase
MAVVGATGAVGGVMLDLLHARGFDDVHAFASARSAGREVRGLRVEEATPDSLAGFDVAFFSVGSRASRELVPHAMRGGALCVDKSEAFRLEPGVPLVVPEVNGERALEHDGVVANPNCSTIPLTLVLKPLHEEAGLRSVRVATYQSASGKGAQRLRQLLDEPQSEHDLSVDWDYDGEEFDEEAKIREETRKILELPELPVSATCVRVPVPVGHAESIWIETEEPIAPGHAREILRSARSVRLADFPTPGKAAGGDEALVGRIRRDQSAENGLSLHLACDNLRKGAALNGIQIAELVLEAGTVSSGRARVSDTRTRV